VVGHQDIEADVSGKSSPKQINRAVLDHDWPGRRVIRYLSPHKPWRKMPWTGGSNTQGEIKQKLDKGEITEKGLWNAYRDEVRLAFDGAAEIFPYLGDEVVITSDHGELLGEEGHYLHARGHPKVPELVNVPWLKVKERS